MDEVAVIETCLSRVEERLLDINIPSRKCNNLNKDERDIFLYNWKDFMQMTKVLLLLFVIKKGLFQKSIKNILMIGKWTKKFQLAQSFLLFVRFLDVVWTLFGRCLSLPQHSTWGKFIHLEQFLETVDNKQIWRDTLAELVEVILEISI